MSAVSARVLRVPDGLQRPLRALAAEPVGALALLLGLVVGLALAGSAGRFAAAAALLAVLGVVTGRALELAWKHRIVAGPVLLLLGVPVLLLGSWFWSDLSGPLTESDGAGRRLVEGTALSLVVSGPILLFGGVRALADRRRAHAGTPWRSLVGAAAADGDAARLDLGQALLGAAMVVTGLGLWAGAVVGVDGGGDVVATTGMLAVGAAALLGLPVLLGLVIAGRRDRAERELALQRQAVAAHLHDSVLQTFALIQRSLDDPERVRRLVRTQERDLRAWLAGREVDALDPLLSGSLRRIADLVEEEHGVTIELDVLDDPPVLEHHRPLLEAAREALRNAARHGRGAPIRVLAETTTDASPATVVYVRDDGPGFDPDDVAPARRGVRDAIVGRMTAAGGSARIDTGPGVGTEVVLTLPEPSAGRGR